MKITILNKTDAKNYIPENTAIIIRMGDSIPFKKLKGKYLDIKEYYFSDVDDFSDYCIQKEDSEDIVRTINKYINEIDEIDEIVVHCEYGQGRSPAVAFAIAEYLKNQNITIIGMKPIEKYPEINKYVYTTLRKEFLK